MRLIKIGNKIINLDSISNVTFIEQPKPNLTLWFNTSSGTQSETIKDDLAVKTWAVLCKLAVDIEIPGASNPWKD